MSIPAGSLIEAVLRQVAIGSLHASTRYDQRPGAVGVTCAPQRSVPSASSRIGVSGPLRPRGSRSTTLALTASWPSRKTVAVTRKVSPATALAGRRPASTSGLTSRTGMRPITVSLSVLRAAVFEDGLAALFAAGLRAGASGAFAAAVFAVVRAAVVRRGAVPAPVPAFGVAADAVAVVRRVVVRRRGAAARSSSAPGCGAAAEGCSVGGCAAGGWDSEDPVRTAPDTLGDGIAGSVRVSESIRPVDSATAASRVSATGVDWSRVSPCMPNSCPRSAAAPAGRGVGPGECREDCWVGRTCDRSLPAPLSPATCPAPAEPVAGRPGARARPGARLRGHARGRPGPPVNEQAGGEDTRRCAVRAEWAKENGNSQREKDSDVLLQGGRHPSPDSPEHQRPSVILASVTGFLHRYDRSFGSSRERMRDRK